ncbi:sulfatase [Nocardioides sp.]|uniref:sulfatase family protein n=1 Tax=Nocardioides sp. TaxID=35761 RepID=UPI003514FE88
MDLPLRRTTTRALCVLAILASLLLTAGRSATAPPRDDARAASARGADGRAPALQRDGRRPNVVTFLVDDMRADELAWMPRTRALLAERGLTFTRGISPHPLCCPARAELLTGQYAQNNGVHSNDGRDGGYQALDPRETLPVWAQRAGYRTAFVGKYLNEYEAAGTRDPGWDVFSPLLAPVYDYRTSYFRGERGDAGYVTDAITERGVAAITDFARGRRPFLVMLNHLAPHDAITPTGVTPPIPARRHRGLYRGATAPVLRDAAFNERRLGDKPAPLDTLRRVRPGVVQHLFLQRIRSLAAVDESVGAVVDALRRTGELDDTWIVFTSDNGYGLGVHRFRSKNVLYDEVLRVPLLIAGPGIPASLRGTRTDRLVSLVDLPATIVDLIGARPRGHRLDGISTADLWQDPPTGDDDAGWRDLTLVQTAVETSAERPGGWTWRGVLGDRYLYGHDPAVPGREFLYDHAVDPDELRNVVDDPRYATVRRVLREQLQRLETCAGRRCNPDVEVPPPAW